MTELPRRRPGRPPWVVWNSAIPGDQHYQETIQECTGSIDSAMSAEGISEEVRKRVLGHLGVSYGPPPPPPAGTLPEGIDWPLAGPPPPWFDPGCSLCDTDQHRCPGCGAPLRHGVPVCGNCQAL